ncbi:MAG: hypothetical protein Q8J88_08445 [Bacteroidales bacterium]|nr:hypothetical protein [Bacteroidales bacterium]
MKVFTQILNCILFIGVLSLFIVVDLSGQEIQSVKLNLNSKTNSDNGLLINQSILNTLSTGTSKPLQQLQINIQVDYICTIGETGFYDNDIILNIVKVKADGDDIYRGFSISRYLIPDHFSGNYFIKEGGKVFNASTFKVQTTSGSNFTKIGFVEPGKEMNLFVEAEITSFSYSTEARDLFQEKISLINEYWASKNMIDSLISQANVGENKIIEEPAAIFVFWDKLRKARLLSNEVLVKTINFTPNSDPADIAGKNIIVDRLITRYATLYKSAINKKQVDVEFARNLAEEQLKSMSGFIQKASFSDFRDSDLLLISSRLHLDNELSSMLKNSSPKADQQLAAGILFGGLVSVADSLFAKSDFSNALSFYVDAIAMNNVYDFVKDKTTLLERTDAAKLGLLQSHLKIAARAVESGNDVLANNYKQKSNAFVSEQLNESLIGQLPEQSDALIQSYIRKGNNFLDNLMYNDAIKVFELASSTARDFYNINHNEQITQGLFAAYRAVYMDLVNQAESFFNAGRQEEAKHRLQQAIDYRQDHVTYLRTSTEAIYLQNRMKSADNTALNSLSDNSLKMQLLEEGGISVNSGTLRITDPVLIKKAKTDIVEQLKAAQLKVWGNSIDEAWIIYGSALENIKRYGLDGDNDIKIVIEELDQRMIERICLNNKFRTEDLMSNVKSSVRNRKYDNLKAMLDEVISIATNNQGCGLRFDEANEIYDFHVLLFQYQQDYSNILNKLFSEGIYDATESYLNFDKTIDMYQLRRFGIQHLKFKDFLIKQDNSTLTIQVIKRFVDNLNIDGVLEYLEVLKNQSFNIEQSLDIQQRVGTLLAVADNTVVIEKPEAHILKITGGDTRLNELKRSYIRSMRELKRSKR